MANWRQEYPKEDHGDGGPQDLLLAQAFGADALSVAAEFAKVLKYGMVDDRMPVEDGADGLKFSGLVEVLAESGRERHLFFVPKGFLRGHHCFATP